MRNFGRGLFRRFAAGQSPLPIAPPTTDWLSFDNFQGGYNSQDSREDTPPNSSHFALNTEVDQKDRIIRCPGSTLVEVLEDQDTQQIGLQASLDNRSELVFFAPPYFGYKGAGATQWVDAGLPVSTKHLYSWANYGGTLIFSNGIDKVFLREPESSLVSVVPEAPLASSYASFAGRVFAGGALVNGNYEPLGIVWTGTEGDPTKWLGGASGYELLINEMSSGDRIVALRPMGLDWLAIICRHSIWVGRRTGVDIRPIDPQPRVGGAGAINEPVCQLTLAGVAFLSDSGVRLFDGNNAPIISQQINNDLLPIDYSKVNEYFASYNPRTNRYYLFTPTDTWVYDLDYQRWYRRSLVARGGTIFAPQSPGLRWQDLIGTWGDQTGTWADYSPEEGPAIDMIFLKGGADSPIDKEDPASDEFFGADMTDPQWDFHFQRGKNIGELWSIKDMYFEYQGEGTIAFYSVDKDAQLALFTTVELDAVSVPTTVALPSIQTGLGVGVSMKYLGGAPLLSKLQLLLQKQGQRVEGPRANPRVDA